MSQSDHKIPSSLSRFREEVSAAIENYLENRDGKLYDMVNYHLGFDGNDPNSSLQGKAIRPCLVLFATKALGGKPDEAMPAAVSLELIHNFSLVHDDIQDDASMRRGRESVQKKWSPAQAINAGDGLKDLSLLALTQLSDGERTERELEAVSALSSYSLRMIQGQVLDLHYMNKEDIGIDGYLKMIRDKTCALLEGSFHLGGIYAGADDSEVETLTRFGRLLGYVYQIRDDWLGIWGQPEKAGKSVKSDLVEKKRSFPVVYAMQEGSEEKVSDLQKIYYREGKLTDGEVNRVRRTLEDIGAREKTNEWSEKYWEEAEKQLEQTEMDDQSKEDLKKFGSFLLKRKK